MKIIKNQRIKFIIQPQTLKRFKIRMKILIKS